MKTAPLPGPDLYETLGVRLQATDGEIRQAFVTLIRRHRDRPGETDIAAIERARQINIAYDTLGDRARRRAYNDSRGIFFAGQAGQAKSSDAIRDEEVVRTDEPISPSSKEDGQTGDQFASEGVDDPILPAPPSGAAAAAALGPDHGPKSGPGDERREETQVQPRQHRHKRWLAAGALASLLALTGVVLQPSMSEFDENPDRLDRGSGDTRAKPADDAGEIDRLPGPTGFAAAPPLENGPNLEPAVDVGNKSPTSINPRKQAEGRPKVQIADAPANKRIEQPLPVARPTSVLRGSSSPPNAVAGPANKSPTAASQSNTDPPFAQRSADSPTESPAGPRTPAKWVSGGLLDTDNPRGFLEGTVGVRFTVDRNGRATGCRAGGANVALGSLTCKLVEQRLQFTPALDGAGRPVPSEIGTSYTWGRRRGR